MFAEVKANSAWCMTRREQNFIGQTRILPNLPLQPRPSNLGFPFHPVIKGWQLVLFGEGPGRVSSMQSYGCCVAIDQIRKGANVIDMGVGEGNRYDLEI